MIQQQHLTPFPTPERGNKTKKLTMPDMVINLKRSMLQISKGTLEDRALGYYEKSGMSLPDFHHMTTIEKLTLLGDIRKDVREKGLELKKLDDKARKEEEKIKLDNLIKQKLDEQAKQQQPPKQ